MIVWRNSIQGQDVANVSSLKMHYCALRVAVSIGFSLNLSLVGQTADVSKYWLCRN